MLIDRERMIQEIILGYGASRDRAVQPAEQAIRPRRQAVAVRRRCGQSVCSPRLASRRNGDGVLEGPDGATFRFKLTYPTGNANYERMVFY